MNPDIAFGRLQTVGAVRLLIAIGPRGLPMAAQMPVVESGPHRWAGARSFGDDEVMAWWAFGAGSDAERFAAAAKLLGGVGPWIAELAGRPEIEWGVLDETTGAIYSGWPVDVEHPERRWAHVEDATSLTLVAIRELESPPAPNPSADPLVPKKPTKADVALQLLISEALKAMDEEKIPANKRDGFLRDGIRKLTAAPLVEMLKGLRPLYPGGPRFNKSVLPANLRNKCPSKRSVERCPTYDGWKSDRAAGPAGRAGASREVDQAVAHGTLRTRRGKSGKAAKPTADEALGGEKRPDKDYENLTDEDREFMATLPDLFPANTARTMRKGASEQLSEEDEAARDEGIDFDVE